MSEQSSRRAMTNGPAVKHPCRACGSTEYRPFGIKNGFHLERCLHCSLVQVTDDLSTVRLKDLYDPDFFEKVYAWQRAGRGRRIAYGKFHYRLREIEGFVPRQGRILDIGCGFGFFLDAARSRGWEAAGIELGGYAARYASEDLDLQVQNVDLQQACWAKGQFDVITLWDVVEHLDDPAADLRLVHRWLKTDGLLAFNTPNVDSHLRRLMGMRWRCFIPPIHITNFSPRSARTLLAATGFRPVWEAVALPYETLLEKLKLFNLCQRLKVSDKLLMFAKKV